MDIEKILQSAGHLAAVFGHAAMPRGGVGGGVSAGGGGGLQHGGGADDGDDLRLRAGLLLLLLLLSLLAVRILTGSAALDNGRRQRLVRVKLCKCDANPRPRREQRREEKKLEAGKKLETEMESKKTWHGWLRVKVGGWIEGTFVYFRPSAVKARALALWSAATECDFDFLRAQQSAIPFHFELL
jgi:hypothetical protein